MKRRLAPQAEPGVHPSLRGSGEDRAAFLLSLFAGLALLALALCLLSGLAPSAADLNELESRFTVIERSDLRPEPLERFLYVTGVLLLPFFLGGAYLAVRRLRGTPKGKSLLQRLATPVSWAMAPLVLGGLASAGLADDEKLVRQLAPGGAVSLAAAAILALGATAAAGERFRERAGRILRFVLPALTGLLLLGVLSFSLLDQRNIRNAPIFWVSFNAVFYSVVQVFFGKELLVDFVNQYGLYPHFLEPVFNLFGLSVLGFTALMGLLTCLAFLCLHRFLARETDDRLLAFLGLATVVFTGYVSGRVASRDLYLQYHPIRLLFPALSLMVARAYAHAPDRRLGAGLSALGGAAFLWNPDTGAVVLAAGFLLIAFDALLRRRAREILPLLVSSLASAAAVVAAFSIFLKVRFGGFPDYARLFVHMEAFYGSGVAMLPMPRFGLWVPVLLVYAAALLRSLAALAEADDTPRARLYFFLSVLGLGLFTYYQGRSTLGNLTAAGYPAVLITVLFVADLRQSAPPPAPAADRLLSWTLLALFCFSLPALASVAPAWTRGIAAKFRDARSGAETEVLRDARFLRDYVRPGQEVVIMSYNSGLHHLMTQTTNPLDIPGDSELVLKRDFDKQMEYAISRRGTFVVDKTTIVRSAMDTFRRLNRISHDNPNGTLVVFPVIQRGRSR